MIRWKIGLILTLILTLSTLEVKADWISMETGVSDDLTGVVFWGDNGVVSGHTGIYYTNDGGIDELSWNRFEIVDNYEDSILYNNTSFNHAFAHTTDLDYAFFCGTDTVNSKSVIMQFHIPSQAYMILFEGDFGTSLNNMNYSTESNQYYAVGNSGLIVKFNLGIMGVLETPGDLIDFTSISFYDEKFSIAANGYKISGVDNGLGLVIDISSATGINGRDVHQTSDDLYHIVGNSVYLVNVDLGSVFENDRYGFGGLNANSIYLHDGHYFIGTDHGIFYQGRPPYTIEWQPTSLNHEIFDFWSQPLSEDLYACGVDGVLLKTDDDGGLPLPFVRTEQDGGCNGQLLEMTGVFGSSASCEWYLNDVLVSSSCTNYATFFDSSGSYEIKLIGTNSSGSDSSMVNFYVVDTPMINLTTFLNDSILCKEEVVEVTINDPQTDIFYSFHDAETLTNYGLSSVSDEEDVVFVTDLIGKTDNYVIQAHSSIAECSVFFSDTLPIFVEKTKADFHTGILNVVEGEEVYFYENCWDANNYKWSFPIDAEVSLSFSPDPVNSFTSLGFQEIELIAWSENDCYDTIVKNGPMLFEEPEMYDSCWVNIGDGNDAAWAGIYFPNIYDLKEVSGGYIICGTFHEQVFPTTYGDSLALDNRGSYLSKYDFNGVHKWSIRANDWEANDDKYAFRSVTEDSQGNIIVAGYFINYYIDNGGDTIALNFGRGQILKLDSLGRNIWTASAGNLHPEHLIVDNSDNIIISSKRRNDHLGVNIKFYRNNELLDTLMAPDIVNFSLTKLDADGYVLWDVPIDNNYVNPCTLRSPQVDDQNNIYMASEVENGATIYDVDNALGLSIPSYNPGTESILVKFDSLGHILWNIYTVTERDIGFDRTLIRDLYTDGDGNSYFSGSNSVHPDYSHQIYSTDDTYIEHGGGEYFVAKVNTDGIAQWVNSAYSSNHGYGYEIDVKDDSIYVLGQARENDLDPWSHILDFTSMGDTYALLDLTSTDYFIATYDTAGVLIGLIKNGDNENYLNVRGWNGFFKAENGDFYTSQSGRLVADEWQDFGDVLYTTNGVEAWVTRASRDCAVKSDPEFRVFVDTTVCVGTNYTLPDDTVFEVEGSENYSTLLVSTGGLDSLVFTYITAVSVDNSITQIGAQFLANQLPSEGVSYQWVDCNDDNEPITDEINQLFVPAEDGNYAVIVTVGTCSEISSCINIIGVGLDEDNKNDFIMYPNPTSGEVSIIFDDVEAYSKIELTNPLGQLMQEVFVQNPKEKFTLKGSNGIYFVHLISTDGHVVNSVQLVKH